MKEIEKTENRKSLPQRIIGLWPGISSYWHYELTAVDDHPITVEKIILAFVFLIMGFLLSRCLTAKMAKHLNRRFGLDEAATFAIQKITHYLLLVLIIFIVLHMVRIPLTFFTIIGGALAIGVGFGSQDIVNNFLSGLILMVEQPAKIGDIVDVDNIYGTVEYVGARSTRIKTFDNLRLVVPNSTLLQSRLINWNLSDDIVRREILVGVQYGTPTRKAAALIRQAVNENILVEKDPQPTVLLYDFGDSALIFKTLIWIKMSKTGMAHQDILQVESEIRFRIDDLFRQNKIAIAFPQRDVHVDTLRPLEITIKQDESFQS